ncbi:MAG: phospholipase D family protein [Ilumatobacteraceae bacterium]
MSDDRPYDVNFWGCADRTALDRHVAEGGCLDKVDYRRIAVRLTDWFLTASERGNPDTSIDAHHEAAWTEGNDCRVLIHGATYFARLFDELSAAGPGDTVLFTGWRSDSEEQLVRPGTEVASVFRQMVSKGVNVRGLLWRSHPAQIRFSEQENFLLVDVINEAGGEAFLDERVRRSGSHHQKLVIIRHVSTRGDLAFVGGIDLAHGRHDDHRHEGDPQVVEIDKRFGPRPAWHDVQVEVHGPAVGDLEHTFRERWDDPEPIAKRGWGRRLARAADERSRPGPLPPQPDDPPRAGAHTVQVLRTYPAKRPPYSFAREGERSIARTYMKAFNRARTFIYIEDQYLWCVEAARSLATALRANPGLHLVVLVPAYPDEDGRVSGPANRVSQIRVLSKLAAAGGDRFAAYNIERSDGIPIYVHAKICIIDDVWIMTGSDNFNRRSWTHDSEASVAIIDETIDEREPSDPGGLGDRARVLPRATRLELWAEHLQDDNVPVDPIEGFAKLAESAQALDRWYAGGQVGERPRGRLRCHRPEPVARWAKPPAEAFYRLISDPDGRPLSMRLRRAY